ncbi:MAG: hypothetical protein Q7S21_05360 [archaeon]|nr:hypothetical protein [archaeon]
MNNFDFELKRKAVHILLSFYPLLFIYLNFDKLVALAISFIYLFLWLFSEFLRTKNIETPTAFLIRKVSRSTIDGTFEKSWKKIRMPNWIIGSTITLILFDYNILLIATIVAVFGDTASGLTRVLLNKKEKKLVGFFAGTVLSMILISIITQNYFLAIVSSAIGMSSELIPIKVNDNLIISPLTGIATFIFR